ncbi:hypothetical protein MNBD_GAMMA07-1813 [hydrothermal vent metagenome]|uniref:Cytoplasmic protein USSDB7A n=1 Tax=hydrothermal vent metagenome TaxID=652676 RepID=A0A3B0X2J3_9ZZZZ
MAIYLDYTGIDGNVDAAGYEKCIAISNVQFGVSRGISMECGNLNNRESTRPVLQEVIITKPADISCIGLFKESCVGKDAIKATFTFVRTGKDKVDKFMDYVLEGVLISNYSMSCTAEGEPTESITLSYTKLSINYYDFDSMNASGSPMRCGYDLAKAAPL